MISVTATEQNIHMKIEGNLMDLLTDARHIVISLAQTLLECASSDKEMQLGVVCCMQSMFSDVIRDSLVSVLKGQSASSDSNDEDEMSDHGLSSIKIDLKALRDWIQNRDTEGIENDDEEI